MNSSLPESGPQHARVFAQTRWSVVLAAADRDSPESAEAMQTLCTAYWYPLYAFARRSGHSADDAADQTQQFFLRLLSERILDRADPGRGRFRSFLLTVFKRFLLNQRDRADAQKRGGAVAHFSIDSDTAEQRYAFEPSDDWTPEAIYDRRWALTLLDQVMRRLEHEYQERGRGELFGLCRGHLAGSETVVYSEIAGRLRMSEAAVRVAAHRLRTRYRELLADEVAATLHEGESIVDELNCLQQAILGKSTARRVTHRDGI